jgi:hypothetical protein
MVYHSTSIIVNLLSIILTIIPKQKLYGYYDVKDGIQRLKDHYCSSYDHFISLFNNGGSFCSTYDHFIILSSNGGTFCRNYDHFISLLNNNNIFRGNPVHVMTIMAIL